MKQTITTKRSRLNAFLIAATILLLTSVACGAGVGLAFRCSLYTFYICLEVISPLVLMVLCLWATHLRLYRGAKSGMGLIQLLIYAVGSDEYRDFGRPVNWLGRNALHSGSPFVGPWNPRE